MIDIRTLRAFLLVAPLAALMNSDALAAADDFSWMRGANYVPSYARNDVAIWLDFDPAVIDRELGYAAKLKLNVVRVFLQQAVYEQNPQRFLDDFEKVLERCARHRIKLMPVLFDSCFDPQTVDLKDYRDKNWMPSPGFARLGANDQPAMVDYLHAVVGAHKDDPRIVLWDVMNEPESTAQYGDWDNGGRRLIDEFVRWALRRAKAENPVQPLTVGWADPLSNIAAMDLVDVICVHDYTAPAQLAVHLKQAQHWGRLYQKPVIINEFVGRPGQPFERALPIVAERKMGWCFWELMIGRTQFSQGPCPYQGLLYPDGTCFDATEVAAVAGVPVEEARRLFPERPFAEIKEDGAIYRGRWTRWTGDGPNKQRIFYANTANSTATFEFNGDTATLIHKVGPDCGIAEIAIDGAPAKVHELDTYAPAVEWNHRTPLVTGMSAGKHVVTLKLTGRKNPAASNGYVQVVDFAAEHGDPQ